MKILGVGLTKTGTSSLNLSLKILGFNSIHFEPERIKEIICGTDKVPDFRRYDDVDAVTDLPAAYFYKELIAAYPKCKCILTIRDEDKWWASIEKHFNVRDILYKEANDPLVWKTRILAYGSATATESLFRKKYREHNARVLSVISKERLLVMDITAGDGWDKLCPFLNCDVPAVNFPRENSDPEPTIKEAIMTIRSLLEKDSSFVLLDHGVIDRGSLSEYEVKAFVERNGVDFGFPLNDEAAIEEVKRLLNSGTTHIIVAWTAFWFFDFYKGWYEYMLKEFKVVHQSNQLVVLELLGR